MYNERAERGDPNLCLFMFHTRLIYKARRTFSTMVLHAFLFCFRLCDLSCEVKCGLFRL